MSGKAVIAHVLALVIAGSAVLAVSACGATTECEQLIEDIDAATNSIHDGEGADTSALRDKAMATEDAEVVLLVNQYSDYADDILEEIHGRRSASVGMRELRGLEKLIKQEC